MGAKEIEITNDGAFDIAIGRNRKETSWKNREMLWSDFVKKVSTTFHTSETLAEYMKAKKPRQDEIKDIGGFVGGYLDGGRRNKTSVIHRQMLTLDLDFADSNVWEDFMFMYDNAALIYSTHKHTPENPRLRLVVMLDRPVTRDEYVAVSRRVAGNIGINKFDDTTYEPERLMYWPSTAKDGEFIFHYQDGPWLSVDSVLKSYRNWRDSSEWPVSERQGEAIHREIKKQADPLEKPGVVGAFCRTYNIHEAIDTFLSDIYEPCAMDNRYTYREGSTAAGLVVYDDKFAYSHHGTDPCSGKLCNSFDLVRVHLFGLRDENVADKTNITKYPSYQAMEEFATKDKGVVVTIANEKRASVVEDFADVDDNDVDWMGELDVDKKGNYLATPKNIDLILKNDPRIKGCFAYDLFFERKALNRLPPWRKKDDTDMFIRDDDEANLRIYLSKEPWGFEAKQKIADGLEAICRDNSFHPVRDYFDGLRWDGAPRLDTLFIDYLGAEDTELNRWITRLTFTAAVYRAFEPGAKFDQIVVLVGIQGCGKSTILEKMSVRDQWFTSSMPSPDKPDKAADHLRGKFIVEIGELVGFKKAEVEAIKNFLSKRSDDFHAPYGKNDIHRPRQCVFFATTNEEQFLRDSSGERRYWPIQVSVTPPKYNLWEDLTPDIVGQIWAEAISHYEKKIPLQLPVELNDSLLAIQGQYKKTDDWQGIIEGFLERGLPANWNTLNVSQRRDYFLQNDPLSPEGCVIRQRISIPEILNECVDLGIKGTPGQIERNRISNCMKLVEGWEKKEKLQCGVYGKQRRWVKIKDIESDEPTVSIP